MALSKLKTLKKHTKFDAKQNKIYFTGKKLLVKIPKRYENYNFLEIEQKINTLGIVDLEIDEKYQVSLLMLSMFELSHRDSWEENINGLTYVVAELGKGDVLVNNTKVLQNSQIAYAMFVEFISYGKLPYFITHDNIVSLFDSAPKMTGAKLNVSHVVFELIYAHLFRDKNEISKFYRHTPMKEEPVFIPLRNVSYAPTSTTAKLLGSYFTDGLNASLVNQQEDVNYKIEDLLRQ